MFRFNLIILGVLLSVSSWLDAKENGIDFDKQIRPILSDLCFHCHGPDPKTREAGLRLDTKEGSRAKLKSGLFAVVPNHPEMSAIIERITTHDLDDIMPPTKSKKKVQGKQIELLKKWISEGAHWSEHWAYVPALKKPLPQVKHETWPKNEIDHFILKRLEEEGLAPEEEADEHTLVRRLYQDLTGLPPKPDRVKAYLADSSPYKYERLIDELLSSKAYGERMAWPWLDLARYSDTNGYQHDKERSMWPWRDWVVQAFNKNMPFDQFSIEQIAGDLLPNSSMEQKLATAFIRNNMINGEGGRIAEENRVEYIFDQLETVGTAWMGTTFQCARCHDHKYDPLTQKEYFEFFAYFNQTPVDGKERSPSSRPNMMVATDKEKARLSELDAKAKDKEKVYFDLMHKHIASLKLDKQKENQLKRKIRNFNQRKQWVKDVKLDQRDDYQQVLTQYEKSKRDHAQLKNKLPVVMIMKDNPSLRKTYILDRGLYNKRQGEVLSGIPAYLNPKRETPKNRLDLAKWLMRSEHPLTSRVVVNRFWAQVFGTGLVKTTENFGTQGERPSHPALLDWLALDFAKHGWDVKRLMKMILMSSTYRQSSKVSLEKLNRDPRNRYLSRGARYRMPSWMIRDYALASSGLLVDKMGGPSVKPYQPDGVWAEMTFGMKRYRMDKGDALYRRSLYTFWRRIVAPTMFFDSATRQTCTVKDKRTNTPLHALATLNDITYNEAARVLAQSLLENLNNDQERIKELYTRVLSRQPNREEWPILSSSIKRLKNEFKLQPNKAKVYISLGESKNNEKLNPSELAAYTAFSLAIMNLDEALNKE